MKKVKSSTRQFEELLETPPARHYMLRLYVTGATPASTHAIENLKKICEEHLHGKYQLEVVDIYQQPALAHGKNIIVAPTLVKELPLPVRRLIGDLSDRERVLTGLEIVQQTRTNTPKGHDTIRGT